ncbi:hypothetical protein ACFX2H_022895 [Malus domestica]
MGKSKASVTVAEVTEDELDREFQHQQILDQFQEFHESISSLNVRYDELQHSFAELSIHQIRQDQLQQTILDEVRALRIPPQPSPQILIGSIPISLGPTHVSIVHTPIPPSTWGLSPSQPLTIALPLGSHMTV